MKSQALQDKVDKILEKRALEIVSDREPLFYRRLFLSEKESGMWRPVIFLSPLIAYVQVTRFKMVTLPSIIASLRRAMSCSHWIWRLCTSRFWYISIQDGIFASSWRNSLSFQCSKLWAFCNTPVLHHGIHNSFDIRFSMGHSSFLLSGWFTRHHWLSSRCGGALLIFPSYAQTWGLGKVWSWFKDRGSISSNAGWHQAGEGVSSRLLHHQILGSDHGSFFHSMLPQQRYGNSSCAVWYFWVDFFSAHQPQDASPSVPNEKSL